MEEYGLIGRELGHSRSPQIWESLFKELPDSAAVRRRYDLFPLASITDIKRLIATHPRLRGFNVTIPYKESILPFLDELTEAGRAIGAVNTVLVDRTHSHPRLIGHNTDAEGFRIALGAMLGPSPMPTEALVLGTGGAAKAVSHALCQIGVGVWCVSRNPRASHQIAYRDLTAARMAHCRLIINATPLGMAPLTDSAPPVPYEFIGTEHILFDLVYNPAMTLFMTKGKARGATVTNGMTMLHEQAKAALRFMVQRHE